MRKHVFAVLVLLICSGLNAYQIEDSAKYLEIDTNKSEKFDEIDYTNLNVSNRNAFFGTLRPFNNSFESNLKVFQNLKNPTPGMNLFPQYFSIRSTATSFLTGQSNKKSLAFALGSTLFLKDSSGNNSIDFTVRGSFGGMTFISLLGRFKF